MGQQTSGPEWDEMPKAQRDVVLERLHVVSASAASAPRPALTGLRGRLARASRSGLGARLACGSAADRRQQL